jgi:hypothetical protein
LILFDVHIGFLLERKKINRRPRFYELRDRYDMHEQRGPTLADNLEYTHYLYFTSTYLKINYSTALTTESLYREILS